MNLKTSKLPQYHALFMPVIQALRALGGSGSLDEVDKKALEFIGLPQEDLEILHDPEVGNKTEMEYRLAWARTYLKKYGLIDNSSRGIWTLTPKAEAGTTFDPSEIVKYVQRSAKENRAKLEPSVEAVSEPKTDDESPDDGQEWRARLYKLLTRELSPEAFERLVQRILRESGFIQVEVTGRSGDGGIDGKGIARIHGIMSFHVVFQCKRYQGVVGSAAVRDFRGATVGRADKGLFITTGSFSRDAIKEATRDGAPPIDLIDGDQLTEKLKELSLGVRVEMVERVTVDQEWFEGI